MNYIILGGNGFIGSHIVDLLLTEGHSVTVLDTGVEKYRKPLPSVEYVHGSISDVDLLMKVFSGKEVLIHCVSTTVPFTSNHNIEFDINSNLISAVNIFDVAIRKGVKRIVYLSSGGAVYGSPSFIPITETHPTEPISSYGITKLAIEKYLHYFALNFGIEYNIIRPSNPYGPRQNPFGNQGIISVFLGKVLKGENLEVWGDPTISKDYLYITDLASAIYKSSITDTTGAVFNVGGGHHTSIQEIISVIAEITGRDINVNFTKGHAFDVKQVCLDISRAKDCLDFQPSVDLRTGVHLTWEFVRNLKNEKFENVF